MLRAMLLLLAGALLVAALALFARPIIDARISPMVSAGVGEPIRFQMASAVPDSLWAPIADAAPARRDQLQIALVNLDLAGEAEILMISGPRRFDVHVPSIPLTIARREGATWRIIATDSSCEPDRIGSFARDGWWDLRCRNEVVLRWDGLTYRAS